MSRTPIATLTLCAALSFPAFAATAGDGEKLIEAAQRQEIKAVKKLLAAGVDVDSKNRYGATALFYACDKGNVELVELLLEHGAEVDVTDTFYDATPLTWTLYSAAESPPHKQIALRLLARGADDADEALTAGVRNGDLELVTAAVESGRVEPTAILAALERAESSGAEKIAEYLRARAPAELEMPVEETAPEQPATDAEDDISATEEAAPLEPLPEPRRGAPIPWPRFRGAGAAGIGDGQGAPTTWDGESGENVRWKTPIPGLAHSSPIVWGDRIFVTTAVTQRGDQSLRTGLYGDVDPVDDRAPRQWQVLALDRRTGEILWQRTASRGRPQVKRHQKSTHANPTPASDGRHLVVSFGSEGLFCYDLDGRLRWKQELGLLSSGWFFDATYEWGFASSPIVHDGKAVVQVDVAKGSYIAAYDLATGRRLWRSERDEISTWGTPAVLPAGDGGGAEIVTNGTTVRGYDAATGEELWRLGPNSEITVASPVVAGGVAYVTGGYPPVRPIYAVVPGGRGDLTLPEGETASDHVLWSQPRGGTYIPTPIVYRGILYVLQNNGRLTAHDATSGELLYRQRVGKAEGFSSSPVAADGRLYFTSESGTTYVVRAGEAFEVLATNELGEVVMTTPAISDGLMVIRGVRHVYGLGAAPGSQPPS